MKIGDIFWWPLEAYDAEVYNKVLANLDGEGEEGETDITIFLWPDKGFSVATITPETPGFETIRQRLEELQAKREGINKQLAESQIRRAGEMLVKEGVTVCPCHLGEDPECPFQLAINDAILRQFEANRDKAMKEMAQMTRDMSMTRLAVRQELGDMIASGQIFQLFLIGFNEFCRPIWEGIWGIPSPLKRKE